MTPTQTLASFFGGKSLKIHLYILATSSIFPKMGRIIVHGLGWHCDDPHQYPSVPNVFMLQTTRLFEIVALLRLWPHSRKEPGNFSKAGDLCKAD